VIKVAFKGSSVYDNNDFFNNYLARRNRDESPNNVIEQPIISELVGDVRGKTVLDLGCGDVGFGLQLLEEGCGFFEGVEGSSKMASEARRILSGTNSQISHSALEQWEFPIDTYDLVTSRLVFHYIEDLQTVFNNVHTALKDGKFVFSVQHPVLTSNVQSAAISGRRTDWILDNYFDIGKREEPWIDQIVVKYHRTIEDYFRILKNAGFHIEDLREGIPQRENFKDEEEFKRRMRIPLFLVFSCRKK
jgi:SAM-dependent methyltransferase